MPESANTNDSVEDLLKKILTNQAGTYEWRSGDGELELYRKILLNQAAGFSI